MVDFLVDVFIVVPYLFISEYLKRFYKYLYKRIYGKDKEYVYYVSYHARLDIPSHGHEIGSILIKYYKKIDDYSDIKKITKEIRKMAEESNKDKDYKINELIISSISKVK